MAGLLEQIQAGQLQRQAGAPGVKGEGYFGSLRRDGGGVSTELSFDFDVNGQKIYAPLLVPTLTKDEVTYLLGGNRATPDIYRKAQDYAMQRHSQGLSAFAANQEAKTNIGQPAVPANSDPLFMLAMRNQFRGGRP